MSFVSESTADDDDETWLTGPTPGLESKSTQSSAKDLDIDAWLKSATATVDFKTRTALSRKLQHNAEKKAWRRRQRLLNQVSLDSVTEETTPPPPDAFEHAYDPALSPGSVSQTMSTPPSLFPPHLSHHSAFSPVLMRSCPSVDRRPLSETAFEELEEELMAAELAGLLGDSPDATLPLGDEMEEEDFVPPPPPPPPVEQEQMVEKEQEPLRPDYLPAPPAPRVEQLQVEVGDEEDEFFDADDDYETFVQASPRMSASCHEMEEYGRSSSRGPWTDQPLGRLEEREERGGRSLSISPQPHTAAAAAAAPSQMSASVHPSAGAAGLRPPRATSMVRPGQVKAEQQQPAAAAAARVGARAGARPEETSSARSPRSVSLAPGMVAQRSNQATTRRSPLQRVSPQQQQATPRAHPAVRAVNVVTATQHLAATPRAVKAKVSPRVLTMASPQPHQMQNGNGGAVSPAPPPVAVSSELQALQDLARQQEEALRQEVLRPRERQNSWQSDRPAPSVSPALSIASSKSVTEFGQMHKPVSRLPQPSRRTIQPPKKVTMPARVGLSVSRAASVAESRPADEDECF